jgi:hypothetical protein
MKNGVVNANRTHQEFHRVTNRLVVIDYVYDRFCCTDLSHDEVGSGNLLDLALCLPRLPGRVEPAGHCCRVNGWNRA